MQPNNNVQNPVPEGPKLETAVKEVVEMENKPVAAEPVKNDISFTDKPKMNNGMLIGLILCLLLAVGGIGFGIWAMMDGNARVDSLNQQMKTQKDSLNEQIEALNIQIETLQSSIEEDETDIETDAEEDTELEEEILDEDNSTIDDDSSDSSDSESE